MGWSWCLVFAKQAAAAHVAVGGSRWLQAGRGNQGSRTVLRAANWSHSIMAGRRARGQRSVAVWLTSSAVSRRVATNRLRLSPLVQSLPIRRTRQWPRQWSLALRISYSVTAWKVRQWQQAKWGHLETISSHSWAAEYKIAYSYKYVFERVHPLPSKCKSTYVLIHKYVNCNIMMR